MKRSLILAILVILPLFHISAQVVTERCWHLDKMQFLDHRQDFWRSHSIFTTAEQPLSGMSGIYNITEAQYGFGLYIIDPPFAKYITGATTALGWKFGSGIGLGVGTGFFKYNDGYTVPLYADLRYFIGRHRVKFFVAMPAGFMINFDNFRDYSKIFANPGVGLTVPLMKSTSLSFSTGLLTQIDREIFDDSSFDGPWHDSFINLKLGLLFGW